jgi:hypothetical protein
MARSRGRLARVAMPLRELSFHEERLRAIFYLIVVPVMIGVILVFVSIDYRHGVQSTARQAKINKANIRENDHQIRLLRNALAETCHATTDEYGIVSALLIYFAAQPPTQVNRALQDTLAGYASDLNARSACGRLTNP